MGRHQKIITRDPKAKPFIESSANRDYVTVIETISADGNTIPPMIILNAASHREHWFPAGVGDDYLVGVSDSGYSYDGLALDWVKHFNSFTAPRQRGVYRLLLFDGHESHTTFEFLSYCRDNKIIPFSLPPHTTHFLQPLDIAVFQPMKHWHGREVDDATRTGCTDFNRFMNCLSRVRRNTFKDTTIKLGWRAAGLISINGFATVCQLQYEDKMMLPENLLMSDIIIVRRPQSLPLRLRSPHSTNTIIRYGQKVLDGPGLHSRFERRNAITQSKAAEQARQKRKNLRRRIHQSGGVLYAQDARKISKKRDEDKVAHTEGVLQRAKDRELQAAKKKAKRLAIDCKKHRRRRAIS
jgi:hypothetical protein